MVKSGAAPARWAEWHPPQVDWSFWRLAALSPDPDAMALAASRAVSENFTASSAPLAFQYMATFSNVSASFVASAAAPAVSSALRTTPRDGGTDFIQALYSAASCANA